LLDLLSVFLLAIILSVLYRFTTSDYFFGIFWPLYCLSFIDLRLLITSLVSFGHYIVWPLSIYDFWLLLWYLLAIILSVLYRFTISDYFFGIFWPLYCLSFIDWRLLITSLVSFGHSIVCPLSIDDFWLLLCYLLAIILSVLYRFTTSDYFFGIFKLFLHIANSSWHWGSYGSIWTGPSPKKYYMDRSFWGELRFSRRVSSSSSDIMACWKEFCQEGWMYVCRSFSNIFP
jgi:hypothetical protein